MLTTSILMATWLTVGPGADIEVSGPSSCPNGPSFGPAMVRHECRDPVETVEVRFYEEGERHCAAVGDSAIGGCYGTCESALQVAAVRAGEVIDHSCDIEPLGPKERPRPTSLAVPRKLEPMRLMMRPSRTTTTPSMGIQANLMIATLASGAHFGHKTAVGFQTGMGVSEDGTQFAMIGSMADITRRHWYWRLGVEVCRGGRAGRWEWNACFGFGGGEFYTGQKVSRQYPWASFSHNTLFHFDQNWAARLDVAGQVAVIDSRFGIRVDRNLAFNPMITIGIQYEIPSFQKNRGA